METIIHINGEYSQKSSYSGYLGRPGGTRPLSVAKGRFRQKGYAPAYLRIPEVRKQRTLSLLEAKSDTGGLNASAPEENPRPEYKYVLARRGRKKGAMVVALREGML